uniref:DUF834 domain-containing protein n=1 Tax=Oryza meridionalis TaxID=40149 RepID=A0A0E0EWQ6_9ORYZ
MEDAAADTEARTRVARWRRWPTRRPALAWRVCGGQPGYGAEAGARTVSDGDGGDWPGQGGGRRQPPDPTTAVTVVVVEAATGDVASGGVDDVIWDGGGGECGEVAAHDGGGGGMLDAWRAAGCRI